MANNQEINISRNQEYKNSNLIPTQDPGTYPEDLVEMQVDQHQPIKNNIPVVIDNYVNLII